MNKKTTDRITIISTMIVAACAILGSVGIVVSGIKDIVSPWTVIPERLDKIEQRQDIHEHKLDLVIKYFKIRDETNNIYAKKP